MARFYLHFHDGGAVYPDDEGAEFADVAAALAEAVQSGREILAEKVFTSDAEHMRYDIVDQTGQIVETVRLAQLRGH